MKPPKLVIDPTVIYFGKAAAQAMFDSWYEEHITPLFNNAREVFGYDEQDALWSTHNTMKLSTHRALLIGIRPVEKPKYQHVLDKILDAIYSEPVQTIEMHELAQKAKEYLK